MGNSAEPSYCRAAAGLKDFVMGFVTIPARVVTKKIMSSFVFVLV